MYENSVPNKPLLHQLSHYIVLSLAVLTPLVVIPLFTNFMVTTKLLLLFVAAIAVLAFFIWDTLKKMSFEVPKSSLVTPLAFFGLSSLFAAVFTTTYPVENILGMGGAYVAAVVIAILGASLLRKASASHFVTALTVAGGVLSVITLLQTVGFGPSRLLNTAFGTDLPHTNLFNVAGAPFVAAQFLGIVLFGHILSFLSTRKLSTLQLVSVPILLIGLAINTYLVLPGKEASPALLPFGVSWSIATDVMKSPRAALIGIGQETYSAAYNQFRPSWTNGTDWWANTFGQASNVPLTLLTTAGLFGLASWAWVLVTVLKESRAHLKQQPVLVGIVVGTFLVQLAFPNNVVLLILQATSLAYFIATAFKGVTKVHMFKTATFDSAFGNASNRSNIAFILPIAIAGLVAVLGLYGVGRAYAASYYFFQSSYALQQNDAAGTYEMQRRAAEMNPYMSVYRSNYALTNLAIATALANKQDITEQERQEVAQLVQQAIREARAATLLRPEDTQNWRVLAQVYRNLIGSAEGADQWAVSSYVQAITTNPSDPTLRIELGGIFLNEEQLNDAILLFQQAAELKPDYPNAYYNLANALKAGNQLQQAEAAYQQTLTLIPADSEDYVRVNQELEELQAAIAEQEPAEGANSAAGTEQTQTESPASSLLNQNVSESENDVVTQPATQPLNVSPEASPAPSASPTPEAGS